MDKELEINNLKLSVSAQEELRKRIIRTAKKNLRPDGKIYAKRVAEICECSVSHVSHTWNKYLKEGSKGVKAVKMGRPVNSGKLTLEQQNEIRKLITDKNPDQLKLPGFLWDRSNVQKLIHQRFGVKIVLQNISVYLKKWGMTSQRPATYNYKQKPQEVQKWLEETYPEIKARAKAENAEIQWGDETGCQNGCNYARGYAPKGQTPTMPIGNTHERVNMISTVTNQGKLRFMFYDGTMNAKVLIQFISRLVKEANRKIFLILDNLKTHHSIMVRNWVTERKDQIELFFLPSYSPQHNPDEYLNGDLKRDLEKKGYSKDKKEIESKARGTMMKLQRNPERVKSYFKAEKIRYAAL